MSSNIEWPEGKDFAFTIFDDPDWDSLENASAIYSFLADLGIANDEGRLANHWKRNAENRRGNLR